MFEALQGEKSHWFRFMDTLIEVNATGYKMPRMNPKAVRPQEMYGETDPQSLGQGCLRKHLGAG